MKYFSNLTSLLILLFFFSSTAYSEAYLSLAPGLMKVDTKDAATQPVVADLRFGYEYKQHLIELAVLTGIKEDELNQLTVEVPSASSIFYHYLPYHNNNLNLHLILGVSQVNIDYFYPNITDTSDTFEGLSFGIGLEEQFDSIPKLKLKIDWIQLYRGDDLNLNILSFGVRYVF